MAILSIWSITTINLLRDNILNCGRTIMSEFLFKSRQHLLEVGGGKFILTSLLNLVSSLRAVYKDDGRKNKLWP